MEQNSVFHTSYDMDYFSNRFLPGALPFSDSFDIPNRRGSINFFDTSAANHHDNMSLFPITKEEENVNDHSSSFKGPQVHNFLDTGLENYFGMKDRDFGFDAYQIVRSRGGSFNFGQLRKESEDIFQVNSDIFKHIRNITDNKNPLENIFSKTTQQVPMYDTQAPQQHTDIHTTYAMQNKAIHNTQLREIAGNIQENASTHPSQMNSTTTNAMDDSANQSAKKRGRKKRMLNDKSEAPAEEENSTKKPSKLGRPKKDNVKINESDYESMMVKREVSMVDEKSTEISSSSKGGLSPASSKPRTDIMTDLIRMNAPQNIKELLHKTNMPSEVKEFIRNSNLMDKTEWLDTRKIGTLTIAERRAKIEKYLAKRRLRTSSRKVNYDCRKRVADSRLRIKGRFVTRVQAFEMLDAAKIPYNPESITNLEIKALLTEANIHLPVIKKMSSDIPSNTLTLKRPASEDFNGFCDYTYGEYGA